MSPRLCCLLNQAQERVWPILRILISGQVVDTKLRVLGSGLRYNRRPPPRSRNFCGDMEALDQQGMAIARFT
jgi:hypothetical protein